jgi:thioredoxin reductase (NADPH)
MTEDIRETNTTNNEEFHDLIIIGGGPAGLSAGLYAARAKLNTVLLEKTLAGGQIMTTGFVENYPGVKKISGMELAQTMEEQAKSFGLNIELCDVKNIHKEDDFFHITTNCKNFKTYAIILTTGVKPRKLNVPGEKEYRGKGVSYCAICDGFFYNGKHVAVIGGGNSAVEEALYLTKYAAKVTVIHRRDQLRAQKTFQDRAFAEPKIEFMWNTGIEEITADNEGFVNGAIINDLNTGESRFEPFDGIFIYIGTDPNLFVCDLGFHTDENGFIITDIRMRTSIDGIFAAGDVRSKELRQIVTAVSDGAIAAISAEEYIEQKKSKLRELMEAPMIDGHPVARMPSDKFSEEFIMEKKQAGKTGS